MDSSYEPKHHRRRHWRRRGAPVRQDAAVHGVARAEPDVYDARLEILDSSLLDETSA